MNHDNGVLALVSGDELGEALKRLPPPTDDGTPETVTAETDSIHHGRVRVTFRRVEHWHRKMRNVFWHPFHAEPVGGQTPPAL